MWVGVRGFFFVQWGRSLWLLDLGGNVAGLENVVLKQQTLIVGRRQDQTTVFSIKVPRFVNLHERPTTKTFCATIASCCFSLCYKQYSHHEHEHKSLLSRDVKQRPFLSVFKEQICDCYAVTDGLNNDGPVKSCVSFFSYTEDIGFITHCCSVSLMKSLHGETVCRDNQFNIHKHGGGKTSGSDSRINGF